MQILDEEVHFEERLTRFFLILKSDSINREVQEFVSRHSKILDMLDDNDDNPRFLSKKLTHAERFIYLRRLLCLFNDVFGLQHSYLNTLYLIAGNLGSMTLSQDEKYPERYLCEFIISHFNHMKRHEVFQELHRTPEYLQHRKALREAQSARAAAERQAAEDLLNQELVSREEVAHRVLNSPTGGDSSATILATTAIQASGVQAVNEHLGNELEVSRAFQSAASKIINGHKGAGAPDERVV